MYVAIMGPGGNSHSPKFSACRPDFSLRSSSPWKNTIIFGKIPNYFGGFAFGSTLINKI